MKFSLLFCTYILSFFYAIFLIILYFSKLRLDNLENKIYRKLLITNIIGIGIQLVCEILSILQTKISLIIVTKLLLAYFIVWLIFFYLYVLEIANIKNNKHRIINMISLGVALVTVAILPFESYINTDKGIYYTLGLDTKYTYFISILYVTIMAVITFMKRKTISRKKAIPIYLLIVFFIMAGLIQFYFPQITIIVQIETFICLIMYFTIENPDLKMLKKMELAKEEAERANRAKSDFLSSMSHEIRTPLNAIVGLSDDIASYKERVPKEVVEDTKDICNASETLLEIVGNILDINKIEANKMEIIEAPYNLKEEIVNMCKITQTRIGEKNVIFHLNIAQDIPYELVGDKGKVKEIINNLLSNAIKYTDEGQVNLTIKCINDFSKNVSNIMITCQDTGKGIKAEMISRLFTKFDRLDVERNTTAEGTGLGLAITKALVEMMGGTINVQSQFGEGSIFMVMLPQKINKICGPNRDEVKISSAAKQNQEVDYGNKKILIVDDNKLNIKVACRALKDFNFIIEECYDGEQCLAKIKQDNTYDLILMDIMMPNMSGETAFAKLKEIPSFATPVIALTADAVAGAKEKYESEGFVGYIAKPFNKEQISELLNKVFDVSLPKSEKEEAKADSAEAYLASCGIDYQKGIELLGDLDTYKQMLTDWCAESETKFSELKSFKENYDIANYAIAVHSLKSDSKYFGFQKLSELAYEHEMKAKANDEKYINQNFTSLEEEFKRIIEVIKNYLKS